jgi:signal transduction histidine kinase
MNGKSDEQLFLLANLPPTQRQRQIALTIVLVLLIAFVITAPFRAIQFPRSAAFIAAFQAVLFVSDLITATFLFAQFSILSWRSLLALASGYLFTAVIAIPYALTFPGLFSPTGLLGAGYQTAGWLYLFWHCGLPVSVIAYALLKETDRATKASNTSTRASIMLSITAVVAAVCALTWVAIAGDDVLPWLFQDEVRISPFGKYISAAVGLLSALALALLWIRRRSVLDLWIMVVLSAWLLEIAFFVLLTALRFSLSFYASRIFALVTASVVLLVFISETTALYVRLARSAQVQRREREGRMITVNAMSASIAHEMSQPIGAIMATAEATLLRLARTPPDLKTIRDSVEAIAADSRRASEVITSVRALFRKGGNKKQVLDVNDLIREVLSIEGSELQRHGVALKTQLDKNAVRVSLDGGQFQQVVLNLITNAVEAMGSQSDRPRELRVRSRLTETGDVQIEIEDSGKGIERTDLDRLFEPFFTTKLRGMGLGLWICQRIIENHNGQLTASSEINRGSIFQILLPVQPEPASDK